jgi:tetratricopeptide (TPR) repeat protein
MKKYILILVALLIAGTITAQDNDTKAQAYYMTAEQYYSDGDFQAALTKLENAEKTLGNGNAKIQHMKVKCLFELKKYTETKLELSKYFEYAKNNKGSDKHNEMLVLLGKMDEVLADEYYADELSKLLYFILLFIKLPKFCRFTNIFSLFIFSLPLVYKVINNNIYHLIKLIILICYYLI